MSQLGLEMEFLFFFDLLVTKRAKLLVFEMHMQFKDKLSLKRLQ